MNFFLTFLLLIVTTLCDAETAIAPVKNDKPSAPTASTSAPVPAAPASALPPTTPAGNKPAAASSTTTGDKPPEPPTEKAPEATKLKTPTPKTNPLTPAKAECNIQAVMSDDEMRLCGIKIRNHTCQFSNATMEVAKLQAALKLQNYYIGDLTGVIDEHTKTAIMVFKELNNLPINDAIDNKLLALLKVDTIVLNKSFNGCRYGNGIKTRHHHTKKHRHKK